MAVKDESIPCLVLGPGVQQRGVGIEVDNTTVVDMVRMKVCGLSRGEAQEATVAPEAQGAFIQFAFVLMSVCEAWPCLVSLVSCHPLPFPRRTLLSSPSSAWLLHLPHGWNRVAGAPDQEVSF